MFFYSNLRKIFSKENVFQKRKDEYCSKFIKLPKLSYKDPFSSVIYPT